jgi:hypothetical protein
MQRIKEMFGLGILSFLLSVVVLLLPAINGTAEGQSVNFTSNLGGSARYGLMSGTTLYSLIGSKLLIHDVSAIDNPTELGSLSIPGKGRRAALNGSTLYIACSEGGLVVVDVSDSTNPQQVNVVTFDRPDRITNTFDVELHGNLAYVADYNGFFILDITNPSSIVTQGSFVDFERDNPHPYGVFISGAYAYVCCEFDGLYIFDISDPATITLVTHYSGSPADNLSDQYYDCVVEEPYLYLAAGGAGVAILNVSDPANPAFVSLLNNDYGGILGLVKIDNLLYPFSEFYNQPEIDVSDPENPQQTEEFDVDGHHSLGISNYADYLILANATYGIRIFDIADKKLDQVGEVRTIGRVMGCEAQGDYAFIAAAQNGLRVIDMTDPSEPQVVASLDLLGYANGIAIDGTMAYMAELAEEGATGGKIEVVDISNPLAPASVGVIELVGEPYDVTIKNGTAYVALQTMGVALVDVSVPSNPQLITSFDSGGSCYKVEIVEDYIIGGDGIAGFFILKQEGSELRNVISGFDLGVVQDIATWDTAVFLPGTLAADGLNVYDISLPFAPAPVTQINSMTDRAEEGQIKAVETFDSYLLIAESVGGLRLFDISDSANPVELDNSLRTIQGDPLKVSYNKEQGLAYVAAQIIGMYVYEIDLPPAPDEHLEGQWIGSGVSADMNIGIAAELDQAREKLAGSIAYYGSTVEEVSVNTTVTDSTTIEDIISVAAPAELSDMQMEYSGVRGYLDVTEMAVVLDSVIEDELGSIEPAADNERGQFGLRLAQPFVDNALAAEDLSQQLFQLFIAQLFIATSTPDGSIAVAVDYLNAAALFEAYVAQSIAQYLRDDLCSDYERRIGFHDDRGDRFMEQAARSAEPPSVRSLPALGLANRAYEKVSEIYDANKPNCPEWGVEKLEGYYEGTVDFLGIISGIFKVCAQEGEAGEITGDIFIELEASDEFMGGPITEATNDITTGISIIDGVFVVNIGDMEIPILIQEWKYNPTDEKWIGTIFVEAQKATGNITLERVGDECPEGWNVK